MSEAFVKIDLHGLAQEEAIKVIDCAIQNAGIFWGGPSGRAPR